MDQTSEIGVLETSRFFLRDLGWICRVQREQDWGVDAHVEICDASAPTNRLLGLQIKAGPSYFSRPDPDEKGWWITPQARHLDYWLYGTLPIVIVLYDVEGGVGYWQVVNDRTAERTGKGWKILIPRDQVLTAGVRETFERLARGPVWAQRFRQLILARRWMKYLAGGDTLIAEFDERVDTATPRGSMRIIHRRWGEEEERVITEWPFYVRGRTTHEEILIDLFDWADSFVDEEYYENALQDRCDTEYGTYEGGELAANSFTVQDLLRRYGNPHPADLLYDGSKHGVYRYILKLNAIGKAFLVTNAYLNDQFAMEEAGFEFSDDELNDEYDEVLDKQLRRSRDVIRAWQCGWELVDEATTCTVRKNPKEPDSVCGKRVRPGNGFRRWEPDERRVVVYCWDCMPDLWVE